MHLMYYLDEQGKRVYTFKKETPTGKVTESAHPARFSPDDKFSRQRVTIKKRFGIYLPDLPRVKELKLLRAVNTIHRKQRYTR